MTEKEPQPIGETLEQLLERVVFSDPDTHVLREEWEATKRTEQVVFERVCREEYEGRVMYHKICQTPNPEAAARHETNLCKILFREELEARLAERWELVRRKVAAILQAKREE